ncbi:MAG TPA: extracellular solute-binding protein, partial [Symbiobacteriaceae bacterium]|nr:extracellular solute-binding protein [Symbiobacteriaceae bacterium]
MRRSLALCLMFALLLAGCTVAPKATTEPPLSGTVRVLVMGGPGLESTLFTGFQHLYPDVKPESVQLPEGDFQQIVDSIMSGATKVDAIISPANSFFFAKGVVDPLDDMVKKSKLSLDEYGATVELGMYKDKLFGLPVSVSPMLLVYNKEMFEQAGLKAPGESWTWDEFEAAANALAAVQAGKEKGWGAAIAPWTLVDLLLTAGKGPADADLTALKTQLARLHRLQSGDRALPVEPLGSSDTDYFLAFARGEVGMLLGYWENSFAHTKPQFSWGVAVPPGDSRTLGSATLAMVTANAENRANAEAFVKFAAGPTGAQAVVRLPGAPVPGMVNDTVKAQWLANAGLQDDSAFVLKLKYLPSTEFPEEMIQPLLLEADAALKGKKTADEAIAAYQQARAPFMSK